MTGAADGTCVHPLWPLPALLVTTAGGFGCVCDLQAGQPQVWHFPVHGTIAKIGKDWNPGSGSAWWLYFPFIPFPPFIPCGSLPLPHGSVPIPWPCAGRSASVQLRRSAPSSSHPTLWCLQTGCRCVGVLFLPGHKRGAPGLALTCLALGPVDLSCLGLTCMDVTCVESRWLELPWSASPCLASIRLVLLQVTHILPALVSSPLAVPDYVCHSSNR